MRLDIALPHHNPNNHAHQHHPRNQSHQNDCQMLEALSSRRIPTIRFHFKTQFNCELSVPVDSEKSKQVSWFKTWLKSDCWWWSLMVSGLFPLWCRHRRHRLSRCTQLRRCNRWRFLGWSKSRLRRGWSQWRSQRYWCRGWCGCRGCRSSKMNIQKSWNRTERRFQISYSGYGSIPCESSGVRADGENRVRNSGVGGDRGGRNAAAYV